MYLKTNKLACLKNNLFEVAFKTTLTVTKVMNEFIFMHNTFIKQEFWIEKKYAIGRSAVIQWYSRVQYKNNNYLNLVSVKTIAYVLVNFYRQCNQLYKQDGRYKFQSSISETDVRRHSQENNRCQLAVNKNTLHWSVWKLSF